MAPARSALSASSSPLTAVGWQFQRTTAAGIHVPRPPPPAVRTSLQVLATTLQALCRGTLRDAFYLNAQDGLDLSRRRNSHASLHAQRPMRAKHARLEPAREGLATRGSPELAQPTFPSKAEGTDAH